jgi:N-hydroxyarylamine O-acetyltransferase
MDNFVFALDAYLERLNYSGDVQPTEDRLEALHRAQAFTIPLYVEKRHCG